MASTTERIPVAPDVLKWARRTSGLDTRAAAKRLGVSEKRLLEFEQGAVHPTINQLRNAAKVYKRPFVVLLLPAPPADFQPLRDFRKAGGTPSALPWSPELHAELKRAVSQREVILELLELAPTSVPSPGRTFNVSSQLPRAEAAARLRTLLGLDGWKSRTWAEPHAALRAMISAIEDLGILVLQTRRVASSEMRGFSLSEWPYPVIALNGSEAPRGRLFTLLHELCHLAINAGGLCDLHEPPKRPARAEDRLEDYCNEVAASILMPQAQLLDDPLIRSAQPGHRWTVEDLRTLSQRYGASAEAVLLRLVNLQLADWNLYRSRKQELDRAYEEARQQRKEAEGGPSFYVIQARNLGHGYVHAVLDAFHARAISSLDVADYLEVRFDQVAALEQAVAS